MTTTVTKLYPTGVLQSSIEFDEITYTSIKVGPTGVYAAQFDELGENLTPITTPSANNYNATGTAGYFFRVYGPLHTSEGYDRIQPGWTCVQIPGSVVVSNVPDPGDNNESCTITITGGTFVLNTFYSFNNNVPVAVAERKTSTGTYMVSGYFDEYTLSFMQADGGTTSTYSLSGTNYKTHTFTSNSTFTIASAGTVDLLLVGGGGGGTVGYNSGPFHSPGRGGDGGYGLTTSTYLAAGTYAIVVGTGGTFGYSGAVPNGGPGGSTTAFGFTAAGGNGGIGVSPAAGNTNGPVSSITSSSYQYGQGGPITPGLSAGAAGDFGTGNGGAGGGDGNFAGGQGGRGVVIVRYVTS